MKEQKLFGMRIKELRVIRKLSQEKLAAKIDISSKYMSRIEMGQQFPSFAVLVKFAKALNLELKDFFDFAHEAKNATELRKSSIALINNASKEELMVIFKFLRALLI